MVFITAGMGGGTGTGAAPIIAKCARERGILTVGVVTKPFHFESGRRMRVAEAGIAEMQKAVDTLIIVPNQNLFRVVNEKTSFADAFMMADQVLCSGVACITDLMVKEGLINLDFADVCSIMSDMGVAMIGAGQATGERHALRAAEAAIANPLFDGASIKGARGLLISITGSKDLTLFDVDEAASRIRQEVDEEANIIMGAIFDPAFGEGMRVSVVATGIDQAINSQVEHISAQSPSEPVIHPRTVQPEPVPSAQTASSAVEADPPIVDATEIGTMPLPSAVIPFPEPTERRRVAEAEQQLLPAVRRRSLFERLSVAVQEKRPPRASGWR